MSLAGKIEVGSRVSLRPSVAERLGPHDKRFRAPLEVIALEETGVRLKVGVNHERRVSFEDIALELPPDPVLRKKDHVDSVTGLRAAELEQRYRDRRDAMLAGKPKGTRPIRKTLYGPIVGWDRPFVDARGHLQEAVGGRLQVDQQLLTEPRTLKPESQESSEEGKLKAACAVHGPFAQCARCGPLKETAQRLFFLYRTGSITIRHDWGKGTFAVNASVKTEIVVSDGFRVPPNGFCQIDEAVVPYLLGLLHGPL